MARNPVYKEIAMHHRKQVEDKDAIIRRLHNELADKSETIAALQSKLDAAE